MVPRSMCKDDEEFLQMLRDEFAAKAMEGELSAMRDHEGEVCGIALDASDDVLARLTKHYYRIADAMLAARSRT